MNSKPILFTTIAILILGTPTFGGWRIGSWRVRLGGDADKVTDQAGKIIEQVKEATAPVRKVTQAVDIYAFNTLSELMAAQKSSPYYSMSESSDSSSSESDEDSEEESEDQSNDKEANGATKPPYTNTPNGQALNHRHGSSDNAHTTPTKNSPNGGYPGMTRSGGKKGHAGVDDPSSSTKVLDTQRYYGTKPGVVTASGPAYQNNGTYLGERVTIVTKDKTGTWESKTLHHNGTLVYPGQTVLHGDIIGYGGGHGDQFRSPESGGPHIDWSLKHNGVPVNPLSGEPLNLNQTPPSKTP